MWLEIVTGEGLFLPNRSSATRPPDLKDLNWFSDDSTTILLSALFSDQHLDNIINFDL